MNTVVGCRHITIKITEKKTNSVKLKNNEKNNTKVISHFLFDTEVFSIQAPMIHMLIDRVSSCHLSLHNSLTILTVLLLNPLHLSYYLLLRLTFPLLLYKISLGTEFTKTNSKLLREDPTKSHPLLWKKAH